MAQLNASYETIMVLSVKNGEESVNALSEKFQKLINENATEVVVDVWGQRALAYPINDEAAGYYLLITFTSLPDFPAELDRIYKITDGVLRSLIVVKEDQPIYTAKDVEKPQLAPVPEA